MRFFVLQGLYPTGLDRHADTSPAPANMEQIQILEQGYRNKRFNFTEDLICIYRKEVYVLDVDRSGHQNHIRTGRNKASQYRIWDREVRLTVLVVWSKMA
jgi:hypothetical protein